ncbi:hypothetical protein ES705_23118 [subsurface metagenome]
MIKNLIKMALKSLKKNRMRSLLTSLGIIIGASAMIVMSAIGYGSQALITRQIDALGTNVLIVFPGGSRRGGVHRGSGSLNRFKFKDVEKIISAEEVAIRFMGNELSVILPGTEREEAYRMAVKIQSSMNRLDLLQVTQGNSFMLTVSIGISVFPAHSATTAELIQKAHELPLMGRARGGNKILFPEDKQGR